LGDVAHSEQFLHRMLASIMQDTFVDPEPSKGA
jgi:hypothetical protein